MSVRRRLGGVATGRLTVPAGPSRAGRGRSRRGADRVGQHASGGVPAVAAALRSGAPPAVAWRRGWGVRSTDGVPEVADVLRRCGGDAAAASAVVAAARLAATTGAPLALVLERVGAALAEEAEIAAQRRAAFAGPRATVRLLAWLPAFGVLLGSALGADPLGVLLDGRGGTALLVAAGVLTWLGSRWGRHLLRTAAPAGDRSGAATRLTRRRSPPAFEVEVAVLLDLLDAACVAGASVPGALRAVGAAVGGCRGRDLVEAAAGLALGAPWAEAWADADAALVPVADALRPSWEDGVAPAGTLRAVGATLRRERRACAIEAAGRLGVRLVLPLGLCHLPAFVLVGLVPILVSMAPGIGSTHR